MKPIVMDKETEYEFMQKFLDKFKKEYERFKNNINETKFNFSMDFSEVATEKVVLLFSQEAYLRMRALVEYYDTEVGWYGLVERLDDLTFRIYDVKVCKQYVDGGKVDTEDKDTLEFFNSLTDDEAEHMHFQAHSHVRMSTSASGTDLQNQEDVVRNMGKTGFYIFQIWNKNDDINTYIYDLDGNRFYDRKDVIIEVEDSLGTLDDWLLTTEDLVMEKKLSAKTYSYTKEYKKEKEKESSYLPGYWNGVDYSGKWEW